MSFTMNVDDARNQDGIVRVVGTISGIIDSATKAIEIVLGDGTVIFGTLLDIQERKSSDGGPNLDLAVYGASIKQFGQGGMVVIRSVSVPGVISADPTHKVTIDEVKTAKYIEIDSKTDSLIALGFTFQDVVFSTSLESQAKWMEFDSIRNDPTCEYPIVVTSADNSQTFLFKDADMIHAAFLTGITTIRECIDSGTPLKEAVSQAVSIDEVNSIIDSRK